MTAATLDHGTQAGLSTRRLSRWTLLGLFVLDILVTLGLFAITPMQGRADFGVVVLVLYLVAQTVLSVAVEGRRKAVDRFVVAFVAGSFVIAVLPLISILVYTISHGVHRFDGTFFTHSMRNVGPNDPGGGAYHAIVGTIEQLVLTTIIAVPIGLLVAIYLTEYARGRFGKFLSFFVDVMTGIPSIVAGLFIYALWIQTLKFGYSGFAGSLALVVIMLPTVIRSSEEMLKLVPPSLREAGYALGMTKSKTVLRIVLPTALPGIVTGVMLAMSRIAGETAPLLLTLFGIDQINNNPFRGPQESLPLYIFNEISRPSPQAYDRAWTAALTLIIIVMAFNLLARVFVRFASRNRGSARA
jgi:phosphate transport system permease protein